MELPFLSKAAANDNADIHTIKDNERIARALWDLPKIGQQVMRLHFHQQLPPEKIADILQMTKDEVDSVILEASERIRLALEEKKL